MSVCLMVLSHLWHTQVAEPFLACGTDASHAMLEGSNFLCSCARQSESVVFLQEEWDEGEQTG